jgi:hypothetical protein
MRKTLKEMRQAAGVTMAVGFVALVATPVLFTIALLSGLLERGEG